MGLAALSDDRRSTAPGLADGNSQDGSDKWIVVVGVTASVVLFMLSAVPTQPNYSRLAVWAAVFLVAFSLLAGFSWMPAAVRDVSPSGVSYGAEYAHFIIGLNWGILLFVDVSASTNATYRWLVLAFVFAVSAGSVVGSSFNGLGAKVLYPMLLSTSLGLAAVQAFAMSFGVLLFLFILSSDLEHSRLRWFELSQLRLNAAKSADKSAWVAAHDSLTGLLNRSGARAELEAWSQHRTTAMFVDLDHFKFVNDRFGHAAGDVVLAEAADRLRGVLRNDDLIARIGGDEFFIVLHGELPDDEVDRLADRLIDELEQPIALSLGDEALISASVGICAVEDEPFDADVLMSRADKAMYVAKRRGRRRAQRFAEDIESELSKRAKLEATLRRDVRDGNLEAYAQPVFSLDTGQVDFIELLARWQTTDGETISPDVFIPMAEEIGLIGEVTGLLLRKAGEALEMWREDPLLSDAKVSINVSPVQVAQGGMVESVVAALERFHIEPERVIVELTESSMLPEIAQSAALFEELCDLGLSLAIDDFGSGYSSLGQLLSLPVSIVKIDKALISEIERSTNQVQILGAIRSLAMALGREVVVEGVERSEQLDLLSSLGIDSVQGFGLCPPVAIDQLAEAVADVAEVSNLTDRRSSRPTPG